MDAVFNPAPEPSSIRDTMLDKLSLFSKNGSSNRVRLIADDALVDGVRIQDEKDPSFVSTACLVCIVDTVTWLDEKDRY